MAGLQQHNKTLGLGKGAASLPRDRQRPVIAQCAMLVDDSQRLFIMTISLGVIQ